MTQTTDAVVIGAGPVGLFQVFQLGLLGLKAELIDVLPEVGGQCAALYPDKPIYDVPGVPVCTGRELARLLSQQAAPFMPADAPGQAPRNLHLQQLVSELIGLPDGGFEVVTDSGLRVHSKVVIVAAGAGAFVPRDMPLPALAALSHKAEQVHYHLPDQGPTPWAGQRVLVSGGGDEALSSVLALHDEADPARRPARIALLHRRAQFQAEAPLCERVQALIEQGQIDLIVGMASDADVQAGRLHGLHILGADSQTRTVPTDHLLIRQGMSPKLGPLSQWGLTLERKQVPVSAATFESHTPGLYAVGDINTYPGKKRLLLCGFHEATLAAHDAALKLSPDAPQHLLYTTTSPLLRQRLGVA